MRKLAICLVLLTGFLCWGMTPALADPPDITGTWTGTAWLVFDGSYQTTTMTVEITHQRRTRFRGTVTFPPPYGTGAVDPLNGVIFNRKELHITSGNGDVIASGLLDSVTAPTRIRGYFHVLEAGAPHTGLMVLDKTP